MQALDRYLFYLCLSQNYKYHSSIFLWALKTSLFSKFFSIVQKIMWDHTLLVYKIMFFKSRIVPGKNEI